jgi:hypothetical protein
VPILIPYEKKYTQKVRTKKSLNPEKAKLQTFEKIITFAVGSLSHKSLKVCMACANFDPCLYRSISNVSIGSLFFFLGGTCVGDEERGQREDNRGGRGRQWEQEGRREKREGDERGRWEREGGAE